MSRMKEDNDSMDYRRGVRGTGRMRDRAYDRDYNSGYSDGYADAERDYAYSDSRRGLEVAAKLIELIIMKTLISICLKRKWKNGSINF